MLWKTDGGRDCGEKRERPVIACYISQGMHDGALETLIVSGGDTSDRLGRTRNSQTRGVD